MYLGVGIHFDGVDGEGRDVGDKVILALALLLLELEGDAADRASLNALHEMSGETSNLVAKTL